MRKFLFGWICRLRGMHRSGKKPREVNLAMIGGRITWTHGVLLFRCICGETAERSADFQRGGRVPAPFEWPVEGKCL